MTGPPYVVTPLRSAGDALAPAIGAAALAAHRTVHAAYADAINRLLGDDALAGMSIEAVLTDPSALPADRRDAILDVGGAHANHQFLWKVLGSGSGGPDGALAAAIDRDFGSLDALQRRFTAAALDLDGPGFAFVSLAAPKIDRLEIVVLPGNGSVLPLGKPGLLICDLWDHAWAADHPDRAAWLAAFWTIVDWRVVGERYAALRDGRQPS